MKLISECLKTERAVESCLEEEGKKIFFSHAEYEFVCGVVEIEKCIFKKEQGGKRCDYLFLFDRSVQPYSFLKSSLAYYVELKGIELVEACKQILNSIEVTKSQLSDEFEVNALVVSSRPFIPRYDNNESYRAVRRLIRKNIQFEITPHTVNLK